MLAAAVVWPRHLEGHLLFLSAAVPADMISGPQAGGRLPNNAQSGLLGPSRAYWGLSCPYWKPPTPELVGPFGEGLSIGPMWGLFGAYKRQLGPVGPHWSGYEDYRPCSVEYTPQSIIMLPGTETKDTLQTIENSTFRAVSFRSLGG